MKERKEEEKHDKNALPPLSPSPYKLLPSRESLQEKVVSLRMRDKANDNEGATCQNCNLSGEYINEEKAVYVSLRCFSFLLGWRILDLIAGLSW